MVYKAPPRVHPNTMSVMSRSIVATDELDPFVAELYREYKRPLCSYVRRIFGPGPPEPEDIVHEAFARFMAADTIPQIPNPLAFLKLTARNVAIDAYRNSVRRKAAVRDVAMLACEHHELDTSDVLSTKEELQLLARAIDTLNPKQRVAFLLHRVEGLSFAEIGRRMGISASGARLLVGDALELCIARMRRLRNV